jgi:outer membrane protein TolC
MKGNLIDRTVMGAKVLLLIGVAVFFAGCSVTPKPLSGDEISRRVEDDRRQMYAHQEPLNGPVSLAEVAARAIKYNLDYRLRMLEQALAQGTLDITTWDMFPRILANAGYVHRTNELGYIDSNGVPSATLVDRTRRIASAEFSWNVLDFGVSYYRSRVAADNVLIAEERKRKVVQNLMQDVRIAYWRALGAQRLVGRIDGLMKRTKTALARARTIEQQGLLPQTQVLAYQRALLDATTVLQSRRQELELAKTELAQLMNLPPNTSFTLVDAPEPQLPPIPSNIDRLEDMALTMRPELREEDYRKRITVLDARRALVSALPGISLDFSRQYDSDRYLLNNSWAEGGLRLSMNLFKLASIPSLNRRRDAQLAVDDTRRMSQAIAVITQVRLASQRYLLAREELDQISESASVDVRIANYAKAAASSRVESELEVIRTEARATLSSYQKQAAYANAQAAFGRLYNSVGLDIDPPAPDTDLRGLTEHIERAMADWHRKTFERPQSAGISAVPLAVKVSGLVDPTLAQSVRDGVMESLRQHGIQTTPNQDGWVLAVRVVGAGGPGEQSVVRRRPASAVGARTLWAMSLIRPDGTQAAATSYCATQPGSLNPQALLSLSQSAAETAVVALGEWLSGPETRFAQSADAPSF